MNSYHQTILIVEDEEADAFFIERAFRDNGVTTPIHIVRDGAEAISYLMGEGKYSDRDKFAFPSFIVTDLKMPVKDGFAVLEHLKANPEWAITPTVVMSASADADDVKKSYLLGASSFHTKPGDYAALREQLKVLHAYWMTCQIPATDATGRQLTTDSRGRLGERIRQPTGGVQHRKARSR